MKHVMIDLETMGTNPDAVICCIGAVEFDPDTGELGREFYERVCWDGCQDGRSLDSETVAWWHEQTVRARAEVLGHARSGRVALCVALKRFRDWLPDDSSVWGNGATFDISILEDAYGHEAPWKFFRVLDVRTVAELARGLVDKPEMAEGTPHHALHDAKHQAAYVSTMWQALRGGGNWVRFAEAERIRIGQPMAVMMSADGNLNRVPCVDCDGNDVTD
jgi:hypothetical protein